MQLRSCQWLEISAVVVAAAVLSAPGSFCAWRMQTGSSAWLPICALVGLHVICALLLRDIVMAASSGAVTAAGRWLLVIVLSAGSPLLSECGFNLMLSTISMSTCLCCVALLYRQTRFAKPVSAALLGLGCAASPAAAVWALAFLVVCGSRLLDRLWLLLQLLPSLLVGFVIITGKVPYWPHVSPWVHFLHRDIVAALPVIMLACMALLLHPTRRRFPNAGLLRIAARFSMAGILLAIAGAPVDTRNLVLPLLPLALEAAHWLGWITVFRTSASSAAPGGALGTEPGMVVHRPAERYRWTVVQLLVLAMWFFWLITPLKQWAHTVAFTFADWAGRSAVQESGNMLDLPIGR